MIIFFVVEWDQDTYAVRKGKNDERSTKRRTHRILARLGESQRQSSVPDVAMEFLAGSAPWGLKIDTADYRTGC